MYYYIVLVILILSNLFSLFLDILSMKSLNRPVPENVADVYDTDRYNKWKAYEKENIRLTIIKNIVSFIIIFLLLSLKIFKYLVFFENEYLNIIIMLLIYNGYNALIDAFIFDYIKEFKIEKKYGFSNMKLKTYISDEVKNFLLAFILTMGLSCLYKTLFDLLDVYVIIIFSLALTIFVFVINLLSSVFIRIFNKLTPLEDGELRRELEALLTSNGYKVKDIYVMDSSKRSTKSNAMFAGLGHMKTIILYDNIIKELSPRELVAVFSHELGHGKHHDTMFGFLRSIVMIAMVSICIYFISSSKEFFTDFGFESISYAFGLIVLTEVFLDFISPLLSLIQNIFSRHQEYRADSFASSIGYGEDIISALKKLTRSNFGDLNPHPLLVKLYYSHPTLSQRINNIRGIKE